MYGTSNKQRLRTLEDAIRSWAEMNYLRAPIHEFRVKTAAK
jgi:hypothetical protein